MPCNSMHGEKMAKIEERLQDASASDIDIGRKITTYLYEHKQQGKDYLFEGLRRIKESWLTARTMSKDATLVNVDRLWYHMVDEAMKHCKDHIDKNWQNGSTEVFTKMCEIQEEEIGLQALVNQRFGSTGNVLASATDERRMIRDM